MSRKPPEPRALPGPTMPLTPPTGGGPAVPSSMMPARQLQEMPKDELEALAEEFGLEPARYKSPQHLVAAIHDRRQLIAAMDRDAMLDVVKWGRRPVPFNASREQLAQEIVKVKAMRFGGLSREGLLVLARLRGLEVDGTEDVPDLVKRLKKQEGLFAKLNRKRRVLLGSLVSKIVGEPEGSEYQFVPPQQGPEIHGASPADAARQASIKEEIEEQGLFGGIAGRIKRSADSYINLKLDEIEARIDRKLDEIDRRLAEWRDKEIANRLRILKVTLWVTVVVAAASLIITYIKVYWIGG